jgi:hypothetical protein
MFIVTYNTQKLQFDTRKWHVCTYVLLMIELNSEKINKNLKINFQWLKLFQNSTSPPTLGLKMAKWVSKKSTHQLLSNITKVVSQFFKNI